MHAYVLVALLWHFTAAADCNSHGVDCVQSHEADETSLVQIKSRVSSGSQRRERGKLRDTSPSADLDERLAPGFKETIIHAMKAGQPEPVPGQANPDLSTRAPVPGQANQNPLLRAWDELKEQCNGLLCSGKSMEAAWNDGMAFSKVFWEDMKKLDTQWTKDAKEVGAEANKVMGSSVGINISGVQNQGTAEALQFAEKPQLSYVALDESAMHAAHVHYEATHQLVLYLILVGLLMLAVSALIYFGLLPASASEGSGKTFRLLDREGPFEQSEGCWNVAHVEQRDAAQVHLLYWRDAFHTFLDAGSIWIQLLLYIWLYVAALVVFVPFYLAISKQCNLHLDGSVIKAYYQIHSTTDVGRGPL